ncbi:S9 family peptidase [Verrucomicrobia bacterium LW23]|nr:S9 family peptidase [Verrucomicrobia bacterium LW23]
MSKDSCVDPYLWLESIYDETALDWVRKRNDITLRELGGDPEFEALRSGLLSIYQSDARIPGIHKAGDYYYNFWRDKKHIRGVWRRTTLDEYRKEQPEWEIVLDLDALAELENENWVWSGTIGLPHDYELYLIVLSKGGGDAKVYREFSVITKSFVEGGFYLAEAKSRVSWIDDQHVYVGTDFGPGSMTSSGYPRLAKRWKRGTPLSSAELVFEGRADDLSVSAYHDHTKGYERDWVTRNPSFYTSELYLNTPGGLAKIDAPDSADKWCYREFILLTLRDDWEVEGKRYISGSLLIGKLQDYLAGSRALHLVFEPTETASFSCFAFTKDYLYITYLEDVQDKVDVIDLKDEAMVRVPYTNMGKFLSVGLSPVDDEESNDLFIYKQSFLVPATLELGGVSEKSEKLKANPEFFDVKGLAVEQFFATSKDGSRIPYFVVGPENAARDGNNPAIIYGYGGFEVSLLPYYSGSMGHAWLSKGGFQVIANIRGGGEYGPKWHRSALRENRMRAYEDFAAVTEDLFARNISSPSKAGAIGGSNGGLLIGNMAMHYPHLYKCLVCMVPLLDMQRYSKLLAGASWMEEYGDPDKEEDWSYLQDISPYHLVKKGVKYPRILFTTSTRDDRVHPGHARKMVARMEELGHSVLYYENMEGGHGGSANQLQEALLQSLSFTFFRQQLMG